MRGRQKYFNVVLIQIDELTYQFDSCRDAAIWLAEQGISKSVGAARVGMSGVLTGRHPFYRHMAVTADRRY